MTPAPLAVVTTTVASADDAQRLADHVVEARLAACVQVAAVDSTYRWQGRLEHAREWRLDAKTPPDRVPALLHALRERHPYEVPDLHVLVVEVAEPAFAAWAEQQTRPGVDSRETGHGRGLGHETHETSRKVHASAPVPRAAEDPPYP